MADPMSFRDKQYAFAAHIRDPENVAAPDGIESRPLWKPMHQQPVFQGCRTYGRAVSDHLFAQGLCIPSGSSLSDGDLEEIIARILSTPGLA